MESNFQFVVGRHAAARLGEAKTEEYRRIADELNELGPAKTPMQWKKAFQDMKSKVSLKAIEHEHKNT